MVECRVEISMLHDKGDPSKVTTTFSPAAETIIQGIIKDREKEIARLLKQQGEEAVPGLFYITAEDIDEICGIMEKK